MLAELLANPPHLGGEGKDEDEDEDEEESESESEYTGYIYTIYSISHTWCTHLPCTGVCSGISTLWVLSMQGVCIYQDSPNAALGLY